MKPLLKITFLNGNKITSKYVFHKDGIVFFSNGFNPFLSSSLLSKIKSIEFINPTEL